MTRALGALLVLATGVAILTHGGTSPTVSTAAVLLSGDEVTPFTVICNAVIDPTQEVAYSATHCAKHASAIAVGGTSICDPGGWEVHRDLTMEHLESDLTILRWNTHATEETAPAAKHAVADDADLWVQGFARQDGDGPTACDLQSLELLRLPGASCLGESSKYRSEHIICSTGQSICPSWSGSGVYDRAGLVGLVVAGTSCGSADGSVLIRVIPQ